MKPLYLKCHIKDCHNWNNKIWKKEQKKEISTNWPMTMTNDENVMICLDVLTEDQQSRKTRVQMKGNWGKTVLWCFFKWGEVTLWELIAVLWKRSTELHIHVWFHPLNPSMNNVYMYELFMQLSWWENLWKYSLVNFMTLVFSLSPSTRISFKCWPSYQLPFIIVLSFLSVSFEIL